MAAREELELLLSQHQAWVELEGSRGWKEYKDAIQWAIRANRKIMEATHIVSLDSTFQVASLKGVIQGLQDAMGIPKNTIEDLEVALIQARDELEFEEKEHGQ